MNMLKAWSNIALSFFFLIAVLGVVMRLAPFSELFTAYKNILHSHSHVAFQGWVYISIVLLSIHFFLNENAIKKKKYKLQLIITLVTIIGIFISFIIEGYAFFSILFSSIFQFLNYWFVYRFFKDCNQSKSVASMFIKTALILLVISTIGPWSVALISSKGLAGSEYFNSALYFFLHFQYNGFFTFSLFAFFYKWLETNHLIYNTKTAKYFYKLSAISIIPAYGMSLLGMSFGSYFFLISIIAGLVQLIAVYFFYKSFSSNITEIKKKINKLLFFLLTLVFGAFIIKNILQFFSCLPNIKDLIFLNKAFIIGYIHLVMLGFISMFLIFMFFKQKWIIYDKKFVKTGLLLVIIGFVVSELAIILSGLSSIAFINEIIFVSSTLMPFGICFILCSQFISQK